MKGKEAKKTDIIHSNMFSISLKRKISCIKKRYLFLSKPSTFFNILYYFIHCICSGLIGWYDTREVVKLSELVLPGMSLYWYKTYPPRVLRSGSGMVTLEWIFT